MRVLCTGASGFIGRHVSAELINCQHEVCRTDIVSDGRDLSLPGALDVVLIRFLPDVVLHLAAQPGRLFADRDPSETIRLNSTMAMEVARSCAKHSVRLAYVSTSEVYGATDQVCREDDDCKPINLYGLTKLWGEQVTRLYAPDAIVIRPSMCYGSHMPTGYGRAALPTFIDDAIHHHEIMVHAGTERSWCYITDIATAIRLVLEQGSASTTYNIGRDDEPHEMLEIAMMACDLAGVDHDLINVVDPPQMLSPVKRLSMDRLCSLGFKPLVNLDDGMRKVYDYLLEGN